jgi:apolipoprotein N-acyltransferase
LSPEQSRRPWLAGGFRDLGLAVASGALLVLCFPAFDAGLLAWVALVPLFLALDGKSPARAFLIGHVAGVVFFAGSFSWISSLRAWSLLDDAVVKGLYLPLYVSAWALAVAWVRRATGTPVALVAPSLWVASEYLRGHASFLSLPWMFLGHSQHGHAPVMQLAALTGAYGVSFLIVLTNAALAEAVLHRRPGLGSPAGVPSTRPSAVWGLATAGLLLGGALVYGHGVLAEGPGAGRATVALVQANVPLSRRRDDGYRLAVLERHAALTRAAVRQGARLVLWPESAVRGDVEHEPALRQAVARLATETRAHLLVGSAEFAKFSRPDLRGKFYNSLVLFSPQGTLEGVYRKMMLVPFGEQVPLRDVVAWPKALVRDMGDFVPGTEHQAFAAGPLTFRAVICWEIIFPDFVRDVVRRGTDFLVVATNEAWFGDSAAPYQLLAMTAVRAVEHRVPIARVANTGVSALIDPFGRIERRLTGADGRELFSEGTLVGDMPLHGAPTFYTRHGDLFAHSQIAFGVVMLLVSGLHRRRREASRTGSDRRFDPAGDVENAATDIDTRLPREAVRRFE